jgi:hypothetical protein
LPPNVPEFTCRRVSQFHHTGHGTLQKRRKPQKILDQAVGCNELLLIYSWASLATAGDNTRLAVGRILRYPLPTLRVGGDVSRTHGIGSVRSRLWEAPQGKPALLFERPARIHSHEKT